MDATSNTTPRRHTEADYSFARLPTAFLHDPRLARLTTAARWVYVGTYLYATEKRLRTLPPHLSDTVSIAAVTRTDQRTASRALQSCVDAGLLSRSPEGALTVANIEDYAHGNAKFRDAPRGEFRRNSAATPDNRIEQKRKEQNRSEDMPSGRVALGVPEGAGLAPEETSSAGKLLARFNVDFSADRQPAAIPNVEPDAADVERQTVALQRFATNRRKCIGLATGTAAPETNTLFDRATTDLPESAFLSACGHAVAWRLANPQAEKGMAGAVLCNRFKLALPQEAAL